MRKFLVLALVVALFLVGNVSVVQVRAAGAVLNVGPGQPFPSISAALAFATPGDAVHVWNSPVPYVENPSVGIPNVAIIGESRGGVVVQPAAPGPCFAVIAPNVAIMELSIVCPALTPGTFGIYLFPSATGCKILENTILNFDYGIVIDNSPSNTVIGNEISNCMVTLGMPPGASCGVFLLNQGSINNVIRGNDFGLSAPNWYHVGTFGASGNTITFNNFFGSPNMPAAFVAPGDINIWDSGVMQKGNFWLPGFPPPYVIDPNNFDKWCAPVPYPWAAQLFDTNRDLVCDIMDVSACAKCFGKVWSVPGWNPVQDVNKDGKVDIKDVSFVARNFGWRDP